MDDGLIEKIEEVINEEWGYLKYYDDNAVEVTLDKILEVLKEYERIS